MHRFDRLGITRVRRRQLYTPISGFGGADSRRRARTSIDGFTLDFRAFS